jgi:quinoprotein glucose dehydrogenase
MKRVSFALLYASVAVAALVAARGPSASQPSTLPSIDWPVHRGTPGGTQYVPVAEINAANVHTLRPAWTYHTGDGSERSNMHVNPIVVNGRMYITTPTLRAVALDAATGREIWTFDPARHNNGNVIRLRNRGVAYWKGAEGERIFHFVRDRVYAIDAVTGALITSFGTGGFIDLRQNLGVDPATVGLEMTSPGAVFENFLILGSRVNESYDASPGHIRAYDTVTGQLRWIFHTIPQRGEFGHETWQFVEGERYGGANAWGGITVDEARGWVFAATGSATEDFYGGFRKGSNLFANSVLALDARTGERKWHYQTVRHDIWDYDNPPAPILVTIAAPGGTARDVVVQLTKMGLVFVLDRDTGQPVFPVQDVPVPASNVPGEEASPTQPVPLKPAPLARQTITEADLTNITPESRAYALREFRRYRSGPIFTPPTLQGTLTQPGHLGGAEWHGASFDPLSNVLYVNVNDAPTINKLRLLPKTGRFASGPDRYTIESYILFTDQMGLPAIAPPWGTLNAVDLVTGDLLWKVPLGEYPELVAKGIRNTGSMNYGGTVTTAGGVIFVAATADEKMRAFESRTGRLLWEHQLPAAGYATPSVYVTGGRQYVVVAAGGGGKNATRSSDAIVAFALPPPINEAPGPSIGESAWIDLFDGKTLNGWVHMNGGHSFSVEDGAIVGQTSSSSASMNSFLCTTRVFGDFELEIETMVDRVTNQGIQIRSRAKPLATGRGFENSAGRVHGPQVEVRRYYRGLPASGMLYGEALGTGWLTSAAKIEAGHRYFVDDDWNRIRIVARGPRIQTWVNGHPVEDLVSEAVYRTNPSGFIGLQIHGISQRELDLPINAGSGVTVNERLVNRWRNIRIRPVE